MSRFLKGGATKASALLERANAQLRGERVSKSTGEDEDDGLGDYLSGLGTRASKDFQWDKFGETSDISISSDDQPKPKPKAVTSPAVSKFLKKKPANQSDGSTTKKPIPSSGTPLSTKSATAAKTSLASKSSILNKAAAYTAKYGKPQKAVAVLSDSDMDMDISLDEEVVNDVRVMKGQAPITTSKSAALSNRKSSLVKSTSSLSDDSEIGKSGTRFLKKKPKAEPPADVKRKDDDDDSEIGGDGSRFLKKKKTVTAKPKSPEIPRTPKKSDKAGSRYQLASSTKYATTVTLDTDEESLADFIGGLSPASSADISGGKTPRTGKAVKQTPSPRSPKGPTSPKMRPKSPHSRRQSPEPMEDIQEVEEESAGTVSTTGSFKSVIPAPGNVNVLDLGDLVPASTPPPERRSSMGKGGKKSSPTTRGTPKSPTKSTPKSPTRATTKSPTRATTKSPTRATTKSPTRATPTSPKSPSKFKKTSGRKKSDYGISPGDTDNFFSSMGLMTVDDLLGSDQEVSQASEVASVVSEISEEIERRSPPLRSILSPTPRSATPKSARGRVRLSLGDLTEIRSRSPSPDPISTARPTITSRYSDDFEDTEEIRTVQSDDESEIDTISERSASSGRSSPPLSVRSRRSSRSSLRSGHRSGRRRSEEYYSDDFTSSTGRSSRRPSSLSTRSSSVDSTAYSDTYTSYTDDTEYSRSSTPSPQRSPREYRKKVKTRNTEVQTGLDPGLLYHWNLHYGPTAAVGPAFGLGTVDPSPIATHVVGADALEAMTAYSPSVLALNDMLRSQLEMTRSFVEQQRHMHRAYIGSMDGPQFRYTTLKDTKKYIKQHRKKKLTFEKALEQVKFEMGLDT